MIFLDTETVGLHGVPVLLQYARDDGPVILYNIWNERIQDTLELLEDIADNAVCGFNLVFDWFHLYKLYTLLLLYPDKSAYPEDVVNELGELEEQARFVNVCLKPRLAHDVMLHARRGPYQSLMERDDIKVRRVPTAISWALQQELERRIKFDEIYFAKAANPLAPKWKIYDIKRPDGTINPDFKDIKLRFRASSGLKNLYRHAFKVTEKVFLFRDIEPDKCYRPREVGWAPFAFGVPTDLGKKRSRISYTGECLRDTYPHDKDWRDTWPRMLPHHTLHWYYNEDARKYASDDVVYTRRLYTEHFHSPEPGDNDSTLTCAVACCRWKGYAVDLPRVQELRRIALEKSAKAPRDSRAVRRYLSQVMDDSEKIALEISTKRTVLEEIADTWVNDDGTLHPAAARARECLDARKSVKEIEVLDKVLIARRMHAGMKITGALSNRMSGDNGLNPQGIKHDEYFRAAFPLADNDTDRLIGEHPDWSEQQITEHKMMLCGGDFKGFEVTIALRVFEEPALTAKVKSGIKVHGIMGQYLFPGKTYEEIRASEGKDPDMYDKGKKGFFLKIYFGNEHTIHNKLGIPLEIAIDADRKFNRDYPRVKAFQDRVIRDFSALQQIGGIGSKIEWRQPKDYSETFLGWRRYFTLENRVIRTLFELAQDPPPSIRSAKIKVQRRDRIQTAGGAAQSALYAAAFSMSSRNVRAAGNNEIQSPGGEITKALQVNLWSLQPSGAHPWIVQPLNVHDEVMVPTKPGYEEQVEAKARETVEKYRKHVPLLDIEWMTDIPDWSNKKGKKGSARELAKV
jgi:hypothetical protein